MRYAILSDVHANLPAITAVRERLLAEKPDCIVSLGDVVGYGAEPDACCDVVRALVDIAVLGNHDAAVSGRMNYAYYYDAAREALDLHAASLSPGNMEWLRSLPYRRLMADQGIDFCHGSPGNVQEFDYVFVLEQARALLPLWDELSPVTFIGHSHLTKCFALSRHDAEEVPPGAFDLDPERKYVITVGSVGQPRDYDARPCYGIFDTETRHFEHRRVVYPVEQAAERIFQARLAINFGKRLFLGV